MTFQNKRLTGILIGIALLLTIPLIAMQFENGVHWTEFDFIVAGILLFGTGLLCELVMRRVKKMSNRIAICGGVLVALAIIWVELAVGIFN
jgi:hypothetical protein